MMEQSLNLFMPREGQLSEPRDRLAAYLRRAYEPRGFAAKRLSKDIRCTPTVAANLLKSHWPSSRHFQRIVQIFGQDVLDAVFGPDINATVARLKREEAELERLLAEKRTRRLQAEGIGARDPQRPEKVALKVVDGGGAR